ncbi:MAG: glycosyltransferase family 2 protein [Chloroflexi bacterium]|nr:glycosyltransferase family 2 protein [Chloroflexota bacterium]
MKLSIVIVSWNTCQLLADCLYAVYAHAPACEFETWVVDNHSADDSVPLVKTQFPQVKLIENSKNVGFASANNQAFRQCSGEYVLLLNPDTKVEPDAVQLLVDFLDTHPQAGAAGSRLLNSDGTLQPSCYPLPTLSRELWRMFHLDKLYYYGQYNMAVWDTVAPREVGMLQGASLLVRRAILQRIGLMDSTYFMYSEEVDLCYRLRSKGWQLYWVPQSQVIHYGGQSTKLVAPQMFEQLYRGKIQYFRKHHGSRKASIYKTILFTAALPRVILAPLSGLLSSADEKAHKRQLGYQYQRLLKTLPGM